MTLPLAVLRVWADAIASPDLVRVGATRHVVPFDVRVDLDDFAECDWSDAGFTDAKLRYLQRRYPLDDLPTDGCIDRVEPVGLYDRHHRDHRTVVYRRVDVTRGWLADALYLRHLGWRGACRFTCPRQTATLHAVPASAVAPAVFAAGLWRGAHVALARTLRRAVVHRAMRMHEGRRAATRRVNDWAHRIASVDDMEALVATLDAQATPRPID